MILRARSLALLVSAAILGAATDEQLAIVVESPIFTLDTRLASGRSTADLVVTSVSSVFTLDTRLAGRLPDLIVQGGSLSFELNTMWVAISSTDHLTGSPIELHWPTNAPGFYPQSALPPLGPTMLWQDVNSPVSETSGLYWTQLPPEETGRYFRLKLRTRHGQP